MARPAVQAALQSSIPETWTYDCNFLEQTEASLLRDQARYVLVGTKCFQRHLGSPGLSARLPMSLHLNQAHFMT